MTYATFGVISPHPPIFIPAVGGPRAHETSASIASLELCARAIAEYDPELIVLMSPHAPGYADAIAVDSSERFEGSLAQFGDSTAYTAPGDPEFARALLSLLDERGVASVDRVREARLNAGWLDHASIVPLHFLEPTHSVPVVILSLSFLPYTHHRMLGESVREIAKQLNRKVVFLASGDLAHRLTPEAPAGYSPRASELDATIERLVSEGRLEALMRIDTGLVEAGGECGLRSFIALGGFCGADPVPTRVLSYEGPWGVGYLTALAGSGALDSLAAIETPAVGRKSGMPGSDDSEIVSLARASIESWVRDHQRIDPPAFETDDLPPVAGAFVSLHRNDQLRGCIGTILPTQVSLAEEVAHNAREAATRDPRFPPITAHELADLDIKVDVLQQPESCDIADLDPKRYGVIVTSGWRRGLLLPDLDGVDEVRQQVAIAMQKAGIAPDEPCGYERFRVDRYT